jgi:RHS repeat-associated protein
MPVAVMDGGGSVNYIHTDHLGTPRAITNAAAQMVWQWDNLDPYGDNVPNENPVGLGVYHFDIGFPGQYRDRETGIVYNINRYLNTARGGYNESDLIGLAGGVNTFGYVSGNPLSKVDPTGDFGVVGALIGGGAEIASQAYDNYKTGCDLFEIDNYNLWKVGVSTGLGSLGGPGVLNGMKGIWPKWMPFVGLSRGPGGAIKNLLEQLERAQTANRIAKVEQRILKNGSEIVDALVVTGAYQGVKRALTNGADDKQCTCKK